MRNEGSWMVVTEQPQDHPVKRMNEADAAGITRLPVSTREERYYLEMQYRCLCCFQALAMSE